MLSRSTSATEAEGASRSSSRRPTRRIARPGSAGGSTPRAPRPERRARSDGKVVDAGPRPTTWSRRRSPPTSSPRTRRGTRTNRGCGRHGRRAPSVVRDRPAGDRARPRADLQNSDLAGGESTSRIPIALLVLSSSSDARVPRSRSCSPPSTIPGTLGDRLDRSRNFMTLSTYLTNMVALIGLGIAIDYSLLIVYRFREELARGRVEGRRGRARRWRRPAARWCSAAATVAIGLALHALHAAAVHARLGLGGLLIPLVSVARGRDAAAGAALLARGRLDRVRLRAAADRSRAATTRARLLGAARALRSCGGRVLFAAGDGRAAARCSRSPCSRCELEPGSNKGIPQDLEAVRGPRTSSTDAVGAGAIAPTAGRRRHRPRRAALTTCDVQAANERLIERARAPIREIARVDFARRAAVRRPHGPLRCRSSAVGKHEYGLPEPAQRLRPPASRRDHAGGRVPGRGRGTAPAAGRRAASTSSTHLRRVPLARRSACCC